MDDQRRDLVSHLFAIATELAEAAHETAVAGQDPRRLGDELIDGARALARSGEMLSTMAAALLIVCTQPADGGEPEQPS